MVQGRSSLRIARERWKLIAAVVIVAAVVALAVTLLTPKTYTASAQVLVSSSAVGGATQAQANAYVQTQVTSYARVIDSPDIVNAVRSDLKAGLTSGRIAAELSASAQAGQSIIDIQVTDGSPSRAAAIANSAARAFIRAIERYSTSTRLFLTGPAQVPGTPTSPRPILNLALGILIGIVVAGVLARVRDAFDNRVRDADSAAKAAGAPLMGSIVEDPRAAKSPVALQDDIHGTRAENFRQLRTNIQFANVDGRARVLAVTSPMSGEGKTTVSVNLADALWEAGFTVCIVDADLRRPNVAKAMGLLSDVGLTSVLIGRTAVRDVLQKVGKGLWVLTSGSPPPNPSEILSSVAMRDTVAAPDPDRRLRRP